MILVFGGTTEGRRAAGTLDEAGSPFLYSTVGDGQTLTLRHATRLTGAMDEEAICRTCRQGCIRLIVDAAHPFASTLHQSVARAARRTGIPVIRYERIYPPRTEEGVTWCDDYDDAVRRILQEGIATLVATTGVKSIDRLASLERAGVRCYYRILDREESRLMARERGVGEERLLYYAPDSIEGQIRALGTEGVAALLMKESGASGGFEEKMRAARHLGMRIFAIRRPAMPTDFIVVDGVYGLRLEVERLLPRFFPLHSGLTTGTCATAAAIGALLMREGGRMPGRVPVVLPDGETIRVAVEYHEGYASAIKHAGDDPDVTDGIEIRARVDYKDNSDPEGITIRGGEGIGIITLPGLDYPVGDWAINRVPRQMIRHNMRLVSQRQLEVEIAAPDGKRLASKTFNPRLGIEGGISIIGVSGIVKPFSEESFVESIDKCMRVAKANYPDMVVVNSGAKSERFLRARFPLLPPQSFVEYGNYVGEALRLAGEAGFRHVVVGIMIGKAVKLAAGNTDTHSKRTQMDRHFVSGMVREATGVDMSREVSRMTLARQLWQIVPGECVGRFARVVISHCLQVCRPLLPNGEIEVVLIDDTGHIYEME